MMHNQPVLDMRRMSAEDLRATALVSQALSRAMQLGEFPVLCFEPYGTLINKEAGVLAALRPLLNKGRVTLGRNELLAMFAECETAQQRAAAPQPYAGILAGAHQRLAKTLGVVSFDVDHQLFAQSVQQWPVYADAPAALQYLRRYFRLFIFSAADRDSVAAGKRQLPVRFDATYSAHETDAYKPDPRSFEYLLSSLAPMGVARERVLLVAAQPDSDLVPAAACGIASAWIDRRRSPGAVEQTPCTFRFASMVDMVRAHQQELIA